MPRVTVFTPTHQRRATLARTAESLAAQTFLDFEWLVVDDGSTDGTDQLVGELASRLPFPVRYEAQPHSGKHVAWNLAVRLAQGELFVVLDSDDTCVPEALERLVAHWDAIPEAGRAAYSGVGCLCRDQHGGLVGDEFPAPVVDADAIAMRYRHRSRGERWGCVRTDVLRRFPFPEPPGVRYIPESLVTDQIAGAYVERFVNEALRVYHRGAPDQLTRYAARMEQAPGLWRLHAHNLSLAPEWFRHSPVQFFKTSLNYSRFSLHLGMGPRAQWRAAGPGWPRALALLGLPGGMLLWADDRVRRRARRLRAALPPGRA